jgi:SSS family solute:Na+ symporter/sodium/proline symporter
MTVKVILLLAFIALTIVIGLLTRKHAANVQGFVLGGRNVGMWLTAFSYGTSYFSAVIFVGYAGQFGWKFGVASTWIGLGNALIGSLLAWLVLGKRTRVMTQELGASTMPDFFGKRFNSNALKVAAAVIVFVFLIPYTASLYNGLSRIFDMAFGIPYTWCVIGMAVITALYVVVGGYVATAWNDFFQGIIMLVGIVAVIAAVLNGKGGFTEALDAMKIVSDPAVANGATGAFAALGGPDWKSLLGVVILTSLGTWGLPQMVHKFYAIKSEKMIVPGAVISTVFALIVAGGCYFLGGFGRLFDTPEFTSAIHNADGKIIFDAIIPAMLSTITSDFLLGIVVMLVFSASMSTLSALVLTSSSTLTLDLLKPALKLKEKPQLGVMRLLIIAFIIISAAIALLQYTSSVTFIAQLMGISWGALAGSFLGPFLWSLYLKHVSKAAVWCSFAVGVGLTVSNMVMGFIAKPFIASPINAGAAAMLISVVIVPLVSLISKSSPHREVAK